MKLIVIALMSLSTAYAGPSTDASSTQHQTKPLATLTDAQIAAIVKTANKGEIDAGEHAKEHASNAKVKKFANMMVTHHTKANEAEDKLLSKLKVTPENSMANDDLQTTAKTEMDKMTPLTGLDYDKAYMGSQVRIHQDVLTSLDDTLIPNAKNGKLKSMLEKTRQKVSQHLKEAKRIQATL
jgi:putative membrane protein